MNSTSLRTSTAVSARANGPGASNASGTSIQAHRAAVATASSPRPLPPKSRTPSRAARRRAVRQSVSDSGRAQARRPALCPFLSKRCYSPPYGSVVPGRLYSSRRPHIPKPPSLVGPAS